ncbi:MAG: FecR family protein [Thermoanaerobaculia bacterium]
MSSSGALPPEARPVRPAEEDEVRDLLARAGAREEPPADDLERIRAATHAAWRQALAAAPPRPRLRLWWVPATVAAGLAAATLLVWRSFSPPAAPAPVVVATVERVEGGLTLESSTAEGRATPSALVAGSPVAAGARLTTSRAGAGGRAALRLAAGGSLRLDAGTRLRWRSDSELELERGAVYFDSFGRDPAAPALAIATGFGRLSDAGTQFEARLLEVPGSSLRLRVRQGAVALVNRAGATVSAVVAAGEEWTLAGDGTVTRTPIATNGPAWGWVLAIVPPFEIEGQRLEAFLAWAGRETGWRIELDAGARAAAAEPILLHGSIAGLAPDEALKAVLAGAGLASRLDGGTLRISRAAGAAPH